MTAIAMTINDYGGDIAIVGGDLLTGTGLVSSVFISLFSDARAPEGYEDIRGWWPDDEQDRFGSLLWTLLREKVTNETVLKAEEYSRKALKWIIEEQIAQYVEVEARAIKPYAIAIKIRIIRGNARLYEELWRFSQSQLITVNNTTIEIEFD